MAAQPRDYPTTFTEAYAMLGHGRNHEHKQLSGTATTLHRVDTDCLQVIYHYTAVVTFYSNGDIKLYTGGWHTPTTARKMNACLPAGWRVWSEKGCLTLVNLNNRQEKYPLDDAVILRPAVPAIAANYAVALTD